WPRGRCGGLTLTEEVQMLPSALPAVVDRLIVCPASGTGQMLGIAGDLEVDPASGSGEVGGGHRPRLDQSQGLCEELVHPSSVPDALRCSKAESTQIAREPQAGAGRW